MWSPVSTTSYFQGICFQCISLLVLVFTPNLKIKANTAICWVYNLELTNNFLVVSGSVSSFVSRFMVILFTVTTKQYRTIC